MHVGREIHRTATHVLIDQEGEADVLQIPLRKIAAVFRRTAPGPTDWVLEERWPGGEP